MDHDREGFLHLLRPVLVVGVRGVRLRGRLRPQDTVQRDGSVGTGLHGEAHFADRPVDKRASGDATLVEAAFHLVVNRHVEEGVHVLVTLDCAAQDRFLGRKVIDDSGV